MSKLSNKQIAFLFAGLWAVAGAVAAARWARPAKLATVAPSTVCMMNDMVMGAPQAPVEVAGKTYYACCADCVKRLNADVKTRVAVDPVSGRPVDKSAAVILEGERGEALYFESEENAVRYARENPRKKTA